MESPLYIVFFFACFLNLFAQVPCHYTFCHYSAFLRLNPLPIYPVAAFFGHYSGKLGFEVLIRTCVQGFLVHIVADMGRLFLIRFFESCMYVNSVNQSIG